jgi:hypothetical protein
MFREFEKEVIGLTVDTYKRQLKRPKAQPTIEYLMTYGWSILIIAAILGIIYQLGFFGGINFLSNSCSAQPGFLCTKGVLNTAGVLAFSLGYMGQSPLNITAVGCSNTSLPTASMTWVGVNVPPLQSGQTEMFSVPCNLNGKNNIEAPFTGTLWVQYYAGNGRTGTQEVGTVNYAVSYAPSTTSTASTTSTSTTSSTSTSSSSTSTSTTTLPFCKCNTCEPFRPVCTCPADCPYAMQPGYSCYGDYWECIATSTSTSTTTTTIPYCSCNTCESKSTKCNCPASCPYAQQSGCHGSEWECVEET